MSEVFPAALTSPLSLLSARSPVFSAMFEHEMEESKKVSPRTQPTFILKNKFDFFLCGSAAHFFSWGFEMLKSVKNCILSNGTLATELFGETE